MIPRVITVWCRIFAAEYVSDREYQQVLCWAKCFVRLLVVRIKLGSSGH